MLNIIIDKLRIAVKRNVFEDREELFAYRDKLKRVLKKYFKDNCYKVHIVRGYLIIEFFPATYKRDDGINIQGMTEEDFYNLFNKLQLLSHEYLVHFNVTEIHLTKNYLVTEDVKNYLKMLLKIKPKQRFYQIPFDNDEGDTVNFTRLRQDKSSINDYTKNKIIKFYAKKEQLQSQKRLTDISKIKLRGKLQEWEQETLGKSYNLKTNEVDLTDLNIVRAEIAYKDSYFTNHVYKGIEKEIDSVSLKRKRSYIAGKNTSDYIEKNLPLLAMIELLQKNNLYNTLDYFYRKELKKILFYENPGSFESIGNIYTIGLQFINIDEPDLYYLKNLLLQAGFDRDNINKKLNTLNKGIKLNKYYKKLYNHIFNSSE